MFAHKVEAFKTGTRAGSSVTWFAFLASQHVASRTFCNFSVANYFALYSRAQIRTPAAHLGRKKFKLLLLGQPSRMTETHNDTLRQYHLLLSSTSQCAFATCALFLDDHS